MSFSRNAIKSVQYGSITVTSDGSDAGLTTANQAISAVNVASSIIECLGFYTNLNADDASNTAGVELTSSTNVRATIYNGVGGATVHITYKVTEYYPQFVKSRQTGTVGLNGFFTVNQAISTVVVAKSLLSFQGQYWGTNGIGGGLTPRNWLGNLSLNAASVTATRGNNTGELDLPFTVLEFY